MISKPGGRHIKHKITLRPIFIVFRDCILALLYNHDCAGKLSINFVKLSFCFTLNWDQPDYDLCFSSVEFKLVRDVFLMNIKQIHQLCTVMTAQQILVLFLL